MIRTPRIAPILAAAILLALAMLHAAHAADAAQSTRSIRELDGNITALGSQGYPVMRLQDLLEEMKALHAEGKYDDVIARQAEALRDIEMMRKTASDLASAQQLLSYAKEGGKGYLPAQDEYDAAKREYARGNIVEAQNSTAVCLSLLASVLGPEIDGMHARALNLSQELAADPLLAPMAQGALQGILQEYDNHDYVAVLSDANTLDAIERDAHAMFALRDRMIAMQEENRSTARIQDALRELTLLSAQGSAEQFSERLNETTALISAIGAISENITATDQEIAALNARGIDTGRAGELIGLAKEDFALEDYESAAAQQQKAAAIVEKSKQETIIASLVEKARSGGGIIASVREHWLLVLALLVVCAALGKLLFDYGTYKYLERKVASLRKEDAARTKILIDLQEQYYKYHRIDKQTYTAGFADYQVRQDAIRELIPRLEKRREMIGKKRHMRLLRKEGK